MIQYQTNRKLISEEFKRLIFAILDSLDQNFTKKNFDQTMEFMEALVAYTRKD
jgi:CRISPR/Cas system CSM-associated protein Csm2 small subunit